MQSITILFVDHFKMIVDALAGALCDDRRFEIVGEAYTKSEGMKMIVEKKPRLVLLNVDMSFLTDFKFIGTLKEFSPVSKIVGLSAIRIPAYAKQVIKEGARGYITLNTTLEEFTNGILSVSKGETFICRDIKNILADKLLADEETSLAMVSRRELIVIDYIRRGFSSKEIAGEMGISIKTAEVHRYNILKKLKLKNTAALVNYVNKEGFCSTF